MATETYTTYEEAAQDYLNAFAALQQAPAVPEAARRGAGDIPAEILIDRADEIAEASASMVDLSKAYVESPDPAMREGISGQLLAQAAAEMQLATELLQIAEEEENRPAPATRAARGVQLREAISAMEKTMAMPMAQGLPAGPVRRGAAEPATLEQATKALEQSAAVTTRSITQRVTELGGDIALNLLLQTEWAAVAAGATLLRKDIAEKLDTVKEGAGKLFARAVTTAAKTILNVYDKILALLGRNVESLARQRVHGWLEKIRAEDQIDLFDTLVSKFYGIDDFSQELKGWLADTKADLAAVNLTAGQVNALAGKFATLAGYLATLETVVVLAKLIKIPQVLAIIAGIQLLLLTVVVYAGFDYIGYKEPRFPNLTKGVAEVIREGLDV
jgi:hypothetical protein